MDLLTGHVGRGPRDLPEPIFPCNRMEHFGVRQVSACQSTSEGRKPLALCAFSTVLVCAIVVPVCSKRSVKNRSRPSNHGASVPSSGRSVRPHRTQSFLHFLPLTFLHLSCLSHRLHRLLLLCCGAIGNAVKSACDGFVCFVPKPSISSVVLTAFPIAPQHRSKSRWRRWLKQERWRNVNGRRCRNDRVRWGRTDRPEDRTDPPWFEGRQCFLTLCFQGTDTTIAQTSTGENAQRAIGFRPSLVD